MIESKLNEIYVNTKITQKIFNDTDSPVEIEIYIQKHLYKMIFCSFYAKVGNSIEIKSKIIKTEKAKEEYTDNFIYRQEYDIYSYKKK